MDRLNVHLKCTLLNPCSDCNKLPELYHLLYDDNYDIVLITISWLNCNMPNSLIDPFNCFTIIRQDRSSYRTGGGAYALIRKSLSIVEVGLSQQYECLELCCFDVHCLDVNLRFINVYRPPHCKLIGTLLSCLNGLIETKNAYYCR